MIEMLFARDEQALAALADKYGRLLRRVAMNILGNAEDAAECENDTYLGAWNAIPPERPNPLSAFLCRIARNLALKKYRDGRAKKRDSSFDVSMDELVECLPSETLEEMWSAKQVGRAIDAWLVTLEPEARRLFLRRYWFADSIKDIARAFGLKQNQTSVRLHRLRAELKDYLAKEGYRI